MTENDKPKRTIRDMLKDLESMISKEDDQKHMNDYQRGYDDAMRQVEQLIQRGQLLVRWRNKHF
jgi:hypothetical protein